MTFSALGQQAPLEKKLQWDVDGRKRRRLQQLLAERLPEYAAGKIAAIGTQAGELNTGAV